MKNLIFTIIALCVALAHILPIPNQFWQYDKPIHIVTYFVLFNTIQFFFKKTPPLSIAAQLFSFGVIIEILQAFSGRSADFADIGANGVGLIAAYYFYLLINKKFSMKKISTIIAPFALTFSAFAQCQVNPDSCALAVKIKSIKVVKSTILLETAQETDIDYFALETKEGQIIEKQAAKNAPSVYRFEVSKSGTYRIKVVNIDNTVEYTKYVTVDANAANYIMTSDAVYFENETPYEVYNFAGLLISRGIGTVVKMQEKGIFIIKTPTQSFKFVSAF